jgi:hypothetical protein
MAGKYIEIRCFGQIAAGGSDVKHTVNVFHYTQSVQGPSISKANIDAIFQTTVVVPLAAGLNARWTQQRNNVRFLDDATDLGIDFTHAAVGAIVGDSMASHVACYILLRTGLRGKSYRGGKHFGPLSESDTTAGTDDLLNTAAITRWQGIGNAINTAMADASGNTWTPFVVSRKLSQLKVNPVAIVGANVVQAALNKRVGRMKRREVKSVY